MKFNNILLIAGTGTKSGKTTMACRIIEQIRHPELVAIKITPHFHETTPGLAPIYEGEGYSIYKENNRGTTKDTSRMLKAGASQVFFAKVTDETLPMAFDKIMEQIAGIPPIICESPAARYYVDPGLFIIMSSNSVIKQKDINSFLKLSHVTFTIEEIEKRTTIPISFNKGKWIYEKESQK